MANRIRELEGGAIGAGGGNPLEPVRSPAALGSATAGTDNGPSTADQVHITASARALANLSQAVQQTPDIDHARVSAVQQALDTGQYQVDADRVAGRMLQLEQDLGGKGSG